jgi:hypothetical protein
VPLSDIARENRKGCFWLLAVLLLLIAALAWLGINTADTQNAAEASARGGGQPTDTR